MLKFVDSAALLRRDISVSIRIRIYNRIYVKIDTDARGEEAWKELDKKRQKEESEKLGEKSAITITACLYSARPIPSHYRLCSATVTRRDCHKLSASIDTGDS